MKDDEYYTRRFLVDLIFTQVVRVYGINKVLYVLAADNDHSYFTAFAKSHKLHYVHNIDLYNVTKFIYPGWKTVVVTNPPFSILIDFLKKIIPEVGAGLIELALIIPITTISTNTLLFYLNNCFFYPFNSAMNMFWHNGYLKSVNTILMTSFPLQDWPIKFKANNTPVGNEFTTPVTRIIYKNYYNALGYDIAQVVRPESGFKRYLWKRSPRYEVLEWLNKKNNLD